MHEKTIALCTSSYSHQLDHLAVIAYVLNIPLVLTDPHLEELAKKYYPFTRIIYRDERDLSLEFLSGFSLIIVSCKHWARELSLTIHTLFQKTLRICYCPHGNSDKGALAPHEDLLMNQDLSFVYGNRMRAMLEKRGVLSTLQGTITTGNYRLAYYKLFQNFYDDLVQREVFSLFDKEQPLILYAPTWKDPEDSSSFFALSSLILESLPSHFNLLVKLHPNLERDDPSKIYRLMGLHEHKKNVVFLSDYPPVYPLLDKTSIYVGDFSSVGYDMLYFDRPLFFLNPHGRDPQADEGLSLFRCGIEIPSSCYEDIFSFIEKEKENNQIFFKLLRKQMYEETFGSEISFEKIYQDLIEVCQTTCALKNIEMDA